MIQGDVNCLQRPRYARLRSIRSGIAFWVLTALNSSQINDSRTKRRLGASFSWARRTHNHFARVSNPDPHRDEPLVEAPTCLLNRAFLGVTPLSPRVAAPRRTRNNGPMTKSELIHRIAQKQPSHVPGAEGEL